MNNSKVPYEFRGELAYAIQKIHSDRTVTISMEKRLY